MAHTNQTTNYQLPQFLGTDKPAWLGDINPAMQTIDTAMKANADGVTSATALANDADNKVGDLDDLQTTVKTDTVSAINEVNQNASTASTTATSAVNVANSASAVATNAINATNQLANQFNFTTTTYNQSTPNGRSIVGGTFVAGDFHVSKNDDNTLFKVYADAVVSGNAGTTVRITLPVSGFTVPDTDYQIAPAGLVYRKDSPLTTQNAYLTVKNGEVVISFTPENSGSYYITLLPCLLINKNFGDII